MRARHSALAALCRQAVDRARTLGVGVDELIDALADYRTVDRRNRFTEE